MRREPLSFLRVNRPECELPEGVDPYGEEVYRRGKENLAALERNGFLIRDPRPGFYLYRLTWGDVRQTGLAALTSVAEYDRGVIKKHEHTRPEKVNDRANHISQLGAQVGPVFLTFRYDDEIAGIFHRIVAQPAPTDFIADDDVRHEVWPVEHDDQIAEIRTAFERIPGLYIADGHHRSEAASGVCRRMRLGNPSHTGEEGYNYFLSVIFPDRELRVLPYNRVVRDLNGLSPDEVLGRAEPSFSLEVRDDPITPTRPHTFGIYVAGRWHLATARDGTFDPQDPTGSIDTAILGTNLLDPILGISDPRTDRRIRFIGGIRSTGELTRLVDSGGFAIAFSLCATSIDQLLAVADAGAVMPAKSTWFEPKLRSGMVVNLLDG